jgi:hypothetical protein
MDGEEGLERRKPIEILSIGREIDGCQRKTLERRKHGAAREPPREVREKADPQFCLEAHEVREQQRRMGVYQADLLAAAPCNLDAERFERGEVPYSCEYSGRIADVELYLEREQRMPAMLTQGEQLG